MSSRRTARGLALTAGAASLIAMGAFTAGCSSTGKDEPAPSSESSATTPATSPTASPTMSPTEKAITPGGENSFTPTVNPTGPNAVCNKIVNGVCVR